MSFLLVLPAICVTIIPALSAYVYLTVSKKASSIFIKRLLEIGGIFQVALILMFIFFVSSWEARSFFSGLLLGTTLRIVISLSSIAISTFIAGWVAWSDDGNIGCASLILFVFAIVEVLLMIFVLRLNNSI
jgi:hypothetical protein